MTFQLIIFKKLLLFSIISCKIIITGVILSLSLRRKQKMNNKIKILICDDSAENGVKLASYIQDNGFYAYTLSKDVHFLLNTIISDMPDVVISDLVLGDSDAVLLINEVRARVNTIPIFIVISEFDNTFIKRQVLESGASFFVTKPFDYEDLINNILKLTSSLPCQRTGDVELMATEIIRNIGIPAHIKGYNFIRTAIINSVYDPTLIESVTKLLYPSVAVQYQTTASRVERAMRHAIEIAWERGNIDYLREYFCCGGSDLPFKPTNSEFIALFADIIRLKLKNSK